MRVEPYSTRMDRNVGPFDARTRIVAGALLAALAVGSTLGYLTLPLISDLGAASIGLVLIVEGASRRCLLYRALGIDRCPVD